MVGSRLRAVIGFEGWENDWNNRIEDEVEARSCLYGVRRSGSSRQSGRTSSDPFRPLVSYERCR